MHRYYLRFSDKSHADSVIAKLKDDVMNVAVNEIGILYNQVVTDQVDKDGNMIYQSVAKDGYHVNIISRYEIQFDESVLVDPSEPKVVFA